VKNAIRSGKPLIREAFLGGVAVVALAAPAQAVRPSGPCDDPDTDPDIDLFQHHDVAEDGNAGVAVGHALSLPETQHLGRKLARLMLDDPDLRASYYHIVRSWKTKFYAKGANHKVLGGQRGAALVKLLNKKLRPPRPLKLSDIGALHLHAFLDYRRAVLALTGHDIDPDALKGATRSFHFGPNDYSTSVFQPSQLGFSDTAP